MADQWDSTGWSTCVDCGRESDLLRCAACTVVFLRCYRRSINAAAHVHRWPWRRAA